MDRLFKCCVCHQTFLVCPNDGDVFHLKDSAVAVKNCENCQVIRRNSKAAWDNTVQVKCQHCGCQTRVPFSSKGYPAAVYCTSCITVI